MLLEKWKNPGSYAGFEPTDDYLLLATWPGSPIADHSNFSVAKELLTAEAVKFPPPTDTEPRDKWVYQWQASCSVRVYVEYLMVRGDAPQSVVDMAESLLQKLEVYPVLDDNDYFEKQRELIVRHWNSLSVKDREDLCQTAECDIAAAQMVDDLPDEVYYELLEEFP